MSAPTVVTVSGTNFIWKKTTWRHVSEDKSQGFEIFTCRACMDEVELPVDSDREKLLEVHLTACTNRRNLRAV